MGELLEGLDGAKVEVVRYLPLSLSVQGLLAQLQPLRSALRSQLSGSSRGLQVAIMLRGSLSDACCLQELRHCGLFRNMRYSRPGVPNKFSTVGYGLRAGIEWSKGGI